MVSLFITGTDTDVGKTVVTSLLTAYFHKKGQNVIPYKPVQSGALEVEGKLVAPDIEIYKRALPKVNEKMINTYLLKKASSPHLAAREENIQIYPSVIIENIRLLEKQHDIVLVEGAGGLIVPLKDDGYSIIHLIKDANIPVLLVARAGLGTINHTILSVMAMREAGIEIAGIIMNQLAKEDQVIEQDNRKMIEKITNIPVIGVVPYIENVETLFQEDDLLNEILSSLQLKEIKI
ncbi:dethiobiotin synthase [Metabacillus fastidiosus]|uniref:dethiobiotin synthase n=1 Tax=Metabacillus fastidiosus TaxID=1458 RepID=UPI002E1A3B72|nr:dethiobiotin synthase [Metabacillus fastidiosus]MED4533295.1 dethiobiotin synthase [Metabacillus fastidiosus]